MFSYGQLQCLDRCKFVFFWNLRTTLQSVLVQAIHISFFICSKLIHFCEMCVLVYVCGRGLHSMEATSITKPSFTHQLWGGVNGKGTRTSKEPQKIHRIPITATLKRCTGFSQGTDLCSTQINSWMGQMRVEGDELQNVQNQFDALLFLSPSLCVCEPALWIHLRRDRQPTGSMKRRSGPSPKLQLQVVQ